MRQIFVIYKKICRYALIMQDKEIFELVLRKEKGCEGKEHEKHYLLITPNFYNDFRMFIFSYTELYNIVDEYIRTSLAFSEFADQITRTLPPDPKYLGSKVNAKKCIMHAALCSLLGPCLLSDYDDPLLLALYQINSILTIIFEKMLPDMKFRSVYYNEGMPLFNIEPAPCYWYAKCAFSAHNGLRNNKKIDSIGLNKTIKLGKQVISKIEKEKLMENKSISPVFLCYASGECNLFSLKEFYNNEVLRAAKKLLKYKSLFTSNIDYEHLQRILMSHQKNEEAIYIYIKQNGNVMLDPNIFLYDYDLGSAMEQILNNLFISFNWSYVGFYPKINGGNNLNSCLEPKENCAYLGLKNRIINHTMNQEIKNKIENGGVYATCGGMSFLSSRKTDWSMLYYQKEYNLNITLNLCDSLNFNIVEGMTNNISSKDIQNDKMSFTEKNPSSTKSNAVIFGIVAACSLIIFGIISLLCYKKGTFVLESFSKFFTTSHVKRPTDATNQLLNNPI